MRISLKLLYKLALVSLVPLIFIVIFVTSLTYMLRLAEQDIQNETHSKFIVAEANDLLRSFLDSGTALYMYDLSDSPTFLNKFNDLRDSIPRKIRTLRSMVRGNPKQLQSLDRIEQLTNAQMKILGEATLLLSEGRSVAKIADSKQELNNLLTEMMAETQRFSKEEEEHNVANPEATARTRTQIQYLLTGGVVVPFLISFFVITALNAALVKRVLVMVRNTENVARGAPLEEPVGGGDELELLDQGIHKMAEDLAEAARRKQELVSMVAHDLRTPLTSVQLALSLLKMRATTEKMSDNSIKQLNTAEHSTRMLLNLIMDLLDIEKMEAGKMVMDKADTVLQQACDEAVDSVEQFARKHKVELEVVDTAQVIYADHDRIVRVLINLLGNSIKFSPEGSKITIDSEALDDCTEVRVSDQGRGIPPEFVDKIFDRFQQVNPGDKQEKKGSGLGLAICKAIVEGHDGEIGVVSELGKGSTFWFRIPHKTQPRSD